MRRQDGLATEFHTLGFGVGASSRRALHDAAAFKLGGNAEHGKHQLGEVGCRINDRLGQ